MPNHFHLLIRVKAENVLQERAQQMNKLSYFIQGKTGASEFDTSLFMSHQFSHFLNSYTQAYNKYWKRMGSLMRPNYKRKEIQHEHYFTRLIYYI